MSGTLFVVATPIGNLDDLTPRARQTLADVDLIAAEDTRHTGRLLSHFGLETPQFALHDHNESSVVPTLLADLEAGRSIALVSDAGTPLISDPGYRLVSAAHEHGIAVSPIPGPSAAIAALSAAGLPTDRFCFEGFLPAKSKARAERLAQLAAEPRTLVFYESVHRVRDTLQALADGLGAGRMAFVGRELTKLHEDCRRAPLAELVGQLQEAGGLPNRGEFVLVVTGAAPTGTAVADADALLLELIAYMPAREAARIAAGITGHKRNALYRRLLELRGECAADQPPAPSV